ncbi:MAG: hypothetical protein MUE42_14060, partial [Opitutaceae bacterium]|nr:hypothetical protein [Opitutaceae bacterium]
HAALDAREESISEESRAENKYDTHAQEAAYLAEGQARIATELLSALAAWRALAFPPPGQAVAQLGSLVTLTTGSRTDHTRDHRSHARLAARTRLDRPLRRRGASPASQRRSRTAHRRPGLKGARHHPRLSRPFALPLPSRYFTVIRLPARGLARLLAAAGRPPRRQPACSVAAPR